MFKIISPLATYEVIQEYGPDHQKEFEMALPHWAIMVMDGNGVKTSRTISSRSGLDRLLNEELNDNLQAKE